MDIKFYISRNIKKYQEISRNIKKYQEIRLIFKKLKIKVNHIQYNKTYIQNEFEIIGIL